MSPVLSVLTALLCAQFGHSMSLFEHLQGPLEKGCGPVHLVFYKFRRAAAIMEKLGAFHVGVLVCGREFHFLGCDPFVKAEFERAHPDRKYSDVINFPVEHRETRMKRITYKAYLPFAQNEQLFDFAAQVPLQMLDDVPVETEFGPEKVAKTVRALVAEQFQCEKYDLMQRNCAHFAKALVRSLIGELAFQMVQWPAQLESTLGAAERGLWANIAFLQQRLFVQ